MAAEDGTLRVVRMPARVARVGLAIRVPARTPAISSVVRRIRSAGSPTSLAGRDRSGRIALDVAAAGADPLAAADQPGGQDRVGV